MNSEIKLEQSWLEHIGNEFDKPYMQALKTFLLSEKKKVRPFCHPHHSGSMH